MALRDCSWLVNGYRGLGIVIIKVPFGWLCFLEKAPRGSALTICSLYSQDVLAALSGYTLRIYSQDIVYTLVPFRIGRAANSIGAEGAEALAGTLPQMARLTALNLRGNEIGAEGVKSLAGTLPQMASLKALDLRGSMVCRRSQSVVPWLLCAACCAARDRTCREQNRRRGGNGARMFPAAHVEADDPEPSRCGSDRVACLVDPHYGR